MKPPVVLLHGLSPSTQWWRSTIEALEPAYETHVVHLPGMRYGDAAEWLGGWLRSKRLEGASLVGHSMGGSIALLTAADNPDVVGRLALIAPAGVFESRRRLLYVVPLLRSLGLRPARVAYAARDVLRANPFRLWRAGSDLLGLDLVPRLGDVATPTLVVWGARDRVLHPSLGEVFASELPNSRLVVLERCGHVPMLEAPEALNAALLAFLEETADERA